MVQVIIRTLSTRTPKVRVIERQATAAQIRGGVPLKGAIVIEAESVGAVRRMLGGDPQKTDVTFSSVQQFIYSNMHDLNYTLQKRNTRREVTKQNQKTFRQKTKKQERTSRTSKPANSSITNGNSSRGETIKAFTRKDSDRITPRSVRAAGVIRRDPGAFRGQPRIGAAFEAPSPEAPPGVRTRLQELNIERQRGAIEDVQRRAAQIPEIPTPQPRAEGVPARLRERGITTFQGVPISRAARERQRQITSGLPEFTPAGTFQTVDTFGGEFAFTPVIPSPQETRIVFETPTITIPRARPISTVEPVQAITDPITGTIQRGLGVARRAEFAAQFREPTVTGRARRRAEAVVSGLGAGALAVTTFPIQAFRQPEATFEAFAEQTFAFATRPISVLRETTGQIGVSPLAETTFLAPTLALNIAGFRGGVRAARGRRVPVEFEQLTVSQARRIRLPSGALEEQAFVAARGRVGREAIPFTAEFVVQREARPSLEVPEALTSLRIARGEIQTPTGTFLARTRAEGRIGGGRLFEEPRTQVVRVGRKGKLGRPRTAEGIIAGQTDIVAEVTGTRVQPRRTTLTRIDEFTGQRVPVGRAVGLEVERITVLGEGIKERGVPGVQFGEVESVGLARGIESLRRDLPTPFQIGKVTRRQLKEVKPKGRRIRAPKPPAEISFETPPSPVLSRDIIPTTGVFREPTGRQVTKLVSEPTTVPSIAALAELDIARSVRLTQPRTRLTPLTAIAGARITTTRQVQFPLTVQQQVGAQRLAQQAGVEALQRQAVSPAQLTIPATLPSQRQVQAVTPISALDQAFLGTGFPGARAGVAPPIVAPFAPPIGAPPFPRPFRLVTTPGRRGAPFAGAQRKPGSPTLAASILGIAGDPFTGKATGFELRPITRGALRLQERLGGVLNGQRPKKKRRTKKKTKKSKK